MSLVTMAARSLQILSLLTRSSPSVCNSFSAYSCRFTSKGVGGAWTGPSRVHRDGSRRSRDAPDEMQELDDVEDKLQTLMDEERKRQKTVKYHILRRQMTPPGPPERKLTWDAMEQIRYLKEEQPEEWTVEQLAEGFNVSPDVIRKVLRSKFVPSLQRKEKQNTKVMARVGLQVLPSGAVTQQDRLKLPGSRSPALLPSGSTEGALVPTAHRTQVVRGEGSGLLTRNPAYVSAPPAQLPVGVSEDLTMTSSTEVSNLPGVDASEEDEEEWDGQVLTEREIEELMDTEKPSPVMQVGNDLFDAEGNFLYRI